jgi:nucleotide-binding universal stress UspA family protein
MVPKRIVVPLDGSPLAERAVRVAKPLASHLGATITLVTSTADGETERPQSYLDSVATLFDHRGFELVVVSDCRAADAIQQTAGVSAECLVCMTTHGRGRLRWAVAGSVAEEVIRESHKPLLLVGPRGEPTWAQPSGRIVVCADGTSCAVAATRQACDWARTLGLEIVITFVMHPLDVEDAIRPEEVFGPLEEIVRVAGIPVHTSVLRSSFVAGALADIADEPETTMLVMGARRHSSVARAVLGSVTMGVLNSASCPVLVIPPGME